jgi:hypothetical protein
MLAVVDDDSLSLPESFVHEVKRFFVAGRRFDPRPVFLTPSVGEISSRGATVEGGEEKTVECSDELVSQTREKLEFVFLFLLLLLSINRIISSVLSLNKRHWLFKAGLSSRVAPRPEKQLSYLFFKDHKYCATAKQRLADDPVANPGTN